MKSSFLCIRAKCFKLFLSVFSHGRQMSFVYLLNCFLNAAIFSCSCELAAESWRNKDGVKPEDLFFTTCNDISISV